MWSETDVSDYHDIVADLEGAFGHDLSPFRIPDSKLEPRVVAARRRPSTGYPAHGYKQLSAEKFCETEFALRQLEGIRLYFENINPLPRAKNFGY